MLPEWSHNLRVLYWQKRACRKWHDACRQRWWRRIAVEKRRLFELGIPYIEIHLVSRHLTNPANQGAEMRLRRYYLKLAQSGI